MVRIRPAKPDDAAAWLHLRSCLWPDGPEAKHRKEIDSYSAGSLPRRPWAVLLAEDRDGQIIGLVELSLRPYAEGCHTMPVAYLEGLFVAPEFRRKGTGRSLVLAAEAWGRSQDCTELASDAVPDNDVSVATHMSLGFTDVGTIRCFRKQL